MTETLAAYSLVAVYSAIAVYAIAFVVFVLDLAKRASRRAGRGAAPAAASARAYQGVDRCVAEKAPPAATAAGRRPGTSASAFALTVLAWVIHVAAIALRGVRRRPRAVGEPVRVHADRAPRSSSASSCSCSSGATCASSAPASPASSCCSRRSRPRNFYVDVTPLPPPLQSAWLGIHVLVAMLATGFFAVGGGLSIVQLLQARREAGKADGLQAPPLVPGLGGARDDRQPADHRRVRPLDLHPHRRRHLGRARLGPLLGLGHQRGLDLHHLGRLRRIRPRARDPWMARQPIGLARDHRLRRRDLQLHDREPVLRRPARVLGAEVASSRA